MKRKKDDLEFYNIEAEEQVIGACLIDPDAILRVAAIIDEKAFYLQKHRLIYRAMLDRAMNQKPVDIALLTDDLSDNIDNVGTVLAELMGVTVTSVHADYYAEIVKREHRRRQLLSAAKRTVELLATTPKNEIDVDKIIGKATNYFRTLAGDETGYIVSAASVVDTTLAWIEHRHAGGRGLLTGISDLDKMLGGIDNGTLIYLAGRPSMGKTSLALQIMRTAHYDDGRQVKPLFVSLEMSNAHLGQKILAHAANVDSKKLRTGEMDDDELARVMRAAATVKDEHFLISDKKRLTLAGLESLINWEVSRGVNLIIIDYLQLLTVGGKYSTDNRNAEISTISRTLKLLAVSLNIPIIALAQLSRNVEHRSDKHPLLSDLRDSGSLEQDADVVLFIYRDDYYNPETDMPNVAELQIAKNRYGETGLVKLYYKRDTGRFEQLARRVINLNGNPPERWQPS